MTEKYPTIINGDDSEMSFEEYAAHDFGLTADQLMEIMNKVVDLDRFQRIEGTVIDGVSSLKVTEIPVPGQNSTG